MTDPRYQIVDYSANSYRVTLLTSLILIVVALIAVYNMEHEGHYITGMNNQIVWGLPHVVAIFLIVSASGALNIASIASVFGREFYTPLSRLSTVVATALLIGGLSVILLDLGRPDRLLIAMSYYNFSSIFAWNIILYTVFIGIALIYLWTLLDWQVEKYRKPVGITAFCWRLILTAGTGSIFGVLVAREAYDIVIMAPMFIVLSLGYGLACYLVVLCLFLPERSWQAFKDRLCRLLVIFIVAGLALSVLYHMANIWWFGAQAFEKFLLAGTDVYPWLVWGGHLILGNIAPLLLLGFRYKHNNRASTILISSLVILGGMAQFYALIIGGQAYPMPLIEGYDSMSTFFDGVITGYSPSHWEIMLGLGGFAISLLLAGLALRVFRILPESP
ncbi:MAG: polysulfide reductase NrfD [Proteobacteria bacterium]|nr:polysulfide reductase NrfD [Pseudomonadota bacterium]